MKRFQHPFRFARACAFAAAFAASLAAQPVQVDPAFAPQLVNDAPDATAALTPLTDGGFLAVGEFTHLGGSTVGGLARLRADGTRDPAFATAFPRRIIAAVPLSGGRVLAATTALANGVTTPAPLLRLLADGAEDTTYTPPAGIDSTFRLIAQPDGRVLAARLDLPAPRLVRLLADGTLDPAFDATASLSSQRATDGVLAVQPDGKILLGSPLYLGSEPSGRFLLIRLNADGTLDSAFASGRVPGQNGEDITIFPDAPYRSVAVQSDGRILAASGKLFLRMLSTGTVDGTFHLATIPGLQRIDRLLPLSNGQIALQARVANVAAGATVDLGQLPTAVFLLAADGSLVRDFRASLPADSAVELVAVQSDNRLVLRHGRPILVPSSFGPLIPIGSWADATASGVVATTLGLANPVLARLDSAGAADSTFAPGFTRRLPASVNKLAVDSAGRLLVSGAFTAVNGAPRPGVARFLADGSLDAAYVPAPRDHRSVELALVQPDGRAILHEIVLGAKSDLGVFATVHACERLLVTGARDSGFAAGALPLGVQFHAVEADGRILISGFEPDAAQEENLKLIRLAADGSRAGALPTTFAGFKLSYFTTASTTYGAPDYPGLANQISSVAALPDGKLLVAASTRAVNGTPSAGLVRLNADGSLDPSYQPALAPPAENYLIPNIALLPGGRALVTPAVAYGRPQPATARLLADGSRDPSFAPLPGANVFAALELSDGRLLSASGTSRWLPDGLPDLNYRLLFAMNAPPSAAAAEFSGGIVLGGSFTSIGDQPQPRTGLARVIPAETAGFTVPPENRTVVAGRTAVLQAALGTAASATYQWTRDGVPVPGATGPALVLPRVTLAQAGAYRLVATVGAQTYTSDAAMLTVVANTARLVNFSARSRIAPGQAPQICGFVLSANPARPVLLRAIGRGLPVDNPGFTLLPQPVLRLHGERGVLAENAGGARAPDIVAVGQRVGAAPLRPTYPYFPGLPDAESTRDSALLVALPTGIYSALTSSGDARDGVSLVEFYDADSAAATSAVVNVSVRARTAPGGDVLIAGFVIGGTGPLRVLVRGIGPALVPQGVTGALADPRITLYNRADIHSENDDWSDQPDSAAVAAAAVEAGAFALPSGGHDAALLVTLEPGIYSVHGNAADGATGEMLIELYALAP